MNVKSILNNTKNIALLDTQVLLAHVLHTSRAALYAFDERDLTPDEYKQWSSLLSRRLAGEPVAYLVGEKECFGMMFYVTPDVLIPRPDTEVLIEVAISCIKNDAARVLDLGTGSGVIACAMASIITHIHVLATDISPVALQVAKKNIERHCLKNVMLRQSDRFQHINETFDLIVSNPPYLAKDDLHLLGEIRYEPIGALVAENSGFALLEDIIQAAKKYLNAGGYICLEHGFEQAQGVRSLFQQNGFKDIVTVKDLSGHERVTYARNK